MRFAFLACFGICVFSLAMGRYDGQICAEEPTPQPVETSMHEFMEYMFQPNYLRLKAQMANEPAATDRAAWKVVKGESLSMAEACNLLIARPPKEDAAEWKEYAAAVRTVAGELYAAGKKKDFAAAKTSYVAMLKKCNACHDHFAEGKHQLTP